MDIIVSGPTLEAMQKAKVAIEEHLGYTQSSQNVQENAKEEDDFIDWDNLKNEHEEAQKVKWAKCPPLVKDFYSEDPDVKALSPGQVAEFRQNNNNIVVSNFDKDSKAPLMNPVSTFSQVRCHIYSLFLIQRLIIVSKPWI